MVDKRFCDWCGKDITDKAQRLLSVSIKSRKDRDWLDLYEQQLCEPCGVEADDALARQERSVRAMAAQQAVRGKPK